MLKLFQLCIVLSIVGLVRVKNANRSSATLVTIQVYYECLCPDSKRFISNQLTPTHQKLGKYFDIEYVPFGKASFQSTAAHGWTFSCQHGPDECTGNKYQACLLNRIESEQIQVQVIDCLMTAAQPHLATEECMAKLGITSPTYEVINTCSNSIEGENLLHDLGVETHNLKPSLYFVPWITFDRVWSQERMESALVDLTKTLCEKELAQVPECLAMVP